MGKEIKIGMLQMSSVLGNIEANCDKIKEIMKREYQSDTDVLVLPEVWTVGWSCKRFCDCAEDINNGYSINFLKELAKEYNINIIGGSIIENRKGKYYNTTPVINHSGDLVTTYSKTHLYSYYGCDEGKYITKGDYPVMVELEGVNYGLTICYDIRFPEIYRAYRKAGADILINCAAWGSKKPIPWEVMTKSRAVENQCYMVALTQCGYIENYEYNLGESRIIDYKGEELSYIKDKEGISYGTIDLDSMYEFRDKCRILEDIRENYEVKVLCAK